MAELSEAEKNRISHRARAVHALRSILIRLVNERLDESGAHRGLISNRGEHCAPQPPRFTAAERANRR